MIDQIKEILYNTLSGEQDENENESLIYGIDESAEKIAELIKEESIKFANFYQQKDSKGYYDAEDWYDKYLNPESVNAITKELTPKDRENGVRRKWIPAKDIIVLLEEIKNDPKLWKITGGFSGADQYQGLPPFIRNIDHIIEKLK